MLFLFLIVIWRWVIYVFIFLMLLWLLSKLIICIIWEFVLVELEVVEGVLLIFLLL